MLCDRIAASKTYLKDKYDQHQPLAYFRHGKAADLMDPQTARELEKMLIILDRKGEDAMVRYVRRYLRGRVKRG